MPLRYQRQLHTSRNYERSFVSVSSSATPRFPCSALHLLQYIVFLARSLSASSVPNYLNVVRLLHLQYGYPNPLEEPLFKHQKTLLMRGIKRLHGAQVSQKLPITPDVLYKMQCHLNFACSFDATFWAACLVAFFSFFRKSNLLPPSTAKFDPQLHLRNCDVRLYPWGIILVVGLKRFNTETAHSWSQFLKWPTPRYALGQR